MTPEPPAARGGVDVPTALAIAVVAYVLGKVVHEGIGHGLTCAALGGRLLAVSSSWCDCDHSALSPWELRAEKAAGTLANLAAAGLAWAVLGRLRGAGYYAAWLCCAVSFFMAAGYLMVDPIFHFGDWGAFLEGLPRPLGFLLTSVGAALTVGGFFTLRARLRPLVGSVRDARRLTLLPWVLVGGAFMTLAAALNRLGPRYAFTSALATVGGTAMLAWMPLAFRRGENAGAGLPRSKPWLVAGAVTAALTLALFGPGISL